MGNTEFPDKIYFHNDLSSHINGLFPNTFHDCLLENDKKMHNYSHKACDLMWGIHTRRPHIGQQVIKGENTLAFNNKATIRQQIT